MDTWEAGEQKILVEDTAHTCAQYLFTSRGGGLSGVQGKDILQPGALGKTVIGGFLDHRVGEGLGVPDGRHMPQDRPACIGSPLLETPIGPPTNNLNYVGLCRQATGNGAGGHHRCNGVNSRKTTDRVIRASRGRFNHHETMAAAVWGGESGAAEDCWRVQGLDSQQSPTLGGLQVTDVGRLIFPKNFSGVSTVGLGETWRWMLVK